MYITLFGLRPQQAARVWRSFRSATCQAKRGISNVLSESLKKDLFVSLSLNTPPSKIADPNARYMQLKQIISRQHIPENVFLGGSQGSRELDVNADDHITALARILGEHHA